MTITYREPRADEAGALALLARETFDETFAHLYQPEDLQAFHDEWKTPAAFLGWMDDPRVLLRVACDGEALVGYAMVGLDQKLDHDPGEKYAVELKQLYLRSSHQGKGVSAKLMEWILAEAAVAKADEIVLSVWSGNDRAQAFYRKFGFDWIADTYFMVGKQRDDEFIFSRTL